MGKVISVAGKGGVGKTTISSLIILELCQFGGPVLAVDADPNHNLDEKLGVGVTRTIGSIREEIMRTKDELPAGVSKQELVDYQIRMALQEGDSFDLLTMGRQEGPGCYCYINSILRSFVDALVGEYDFVVIDNEAGLEHLSRRTSVENDLLLVVSDPTAVSLRAAERIAMLADEMELKVGRKTLAINMCDKMPSDDRLSVLPDAGFESTYCVRPDSAIKALSETGKPLTEIRNITPAIEDVRRIIDNELKNRPSSAR